MKKLELLCTARENVKWCSTMENSIEVPQRIRITTTICSSNSTSGYIPENKKQDEPEVKKFSKKDGCSLKVHRSQPKELLMAKARTI